MIEGAWKAVPWYYFSGCNTYREDYFAQAGEPPPDTYDALLRAGRKLKKLGHPVVTDRGVAASSYLVYLLSSLEASNLPERSVARRGPGPPPASLAAAAQRRTIVGYPRCRFGLRASYHTCL